MDWYYTIAWTPFMSLKDLLSAKGALYMVTVADNNPKEIMGMMRSHGFCCEVG